MGSGLMSGQGWDNAEFRCGSCGDSFTATTEQEYVNRYSAHVNAHALVSLMSPEAIAELKSILARFPVVAT